MDKAKFCVGVVEFVSYAIEDIIADVATAGVAQVDVETLILQLLHQLVGRYGGKVGCRSILYNGLVPWSASHIVLHKCVLYIYGDCINMHFGGATVHTQH